MLPQTTAVEANAEEGSVGVQQSRLQEMGRTVRVRNEVVRHRGHVLRCKEKVRREADGHLKEGTCGVSLPEEVGI